MSMQTKMQQAFDHWEGLLRATRGALVPTKCFCYLIDFHYKNNMWQYSTKMQKPGELSIKDNTQKRVTIPRLEAHEAC